MTGKSYADAVERNVESRRIPALCLHPREVAVTAPRIMETTTSVAIKWLIGCMPAYSYMNGESPVPG